AGPRRGPVSRGARRPDVEREHDRRRRRVLAVGRRVLGRRIRGVAMNRYALSLLLVPAFALAQPKDVNVTRGPAAELYIKKRPLAPEAPVLSQELKDMLLVAEKKRDDKRL